MSPNQKYSLTVNQVLCCWDLWSVWIVTCGTRSFSHWVNDSTILLLRHVHDLWFGISTRFPFMFIPLQLLLDHVRDCPTPHLSNFQTFCALTRFYDLRIAALPYFLPVSGLPVCLEALLCFVVVDLFTQKHPTLVMAMVLFTAKASNICHCHDSVHVKSVQHLRWLWIYSRRKSVLHSWWPWICSPKASWTCDGCGSVHTKASNTCYSSGSVHATKASYPRDGHGFVHTKVSNTCNGYSQTLHAVGKEWLEDTSRHCFDPTGLEKADCSICTHHIFHEHRRFERFHVRILTL